MANEPGITLRAEDLESMHQKLTQFMKTLPQTERDAMAVLLARAASARAHGDREINDYLTTAAPPAEVPLPVLARAIDGRSDIRPELWSYTVWTYNNK